MCWSGKGRPPSVGMQTQPLTITKYLTFLSVIFVAGCAETTYWVKPGGNQFQFDSEQAGCHNQAYFLPQVKTEKSTPGYQIETTRFGSSYYSTVTPYSNPYQNLADAFISLGDTFENIAIKEQFMENCMVAKGWRRVDKNAIALTVSAYAIVGSKKAAYEGSATGYPDHTGTIKMKSADGSVCVGNFRYTHSRGGNGLVRCDDGASAKITFTAITNSSGYGSGTSNQGEVVKFVYGLEGEEKDKFLKTSN